MSRCILFLALFICCHISGMDDSKESVAITIPDGAFAGSEDLSPGSQDSDNLDRLKEVLAQQRSAAKKLMNDEARINEIGTKALERYFYGNHDRIAPFVRSRLEKKMRDATGLDEYRPSMLRMSSLCSEGQQRTTHEDRRTSFHEMDERMSTLVSLSLEEAFSEYEKKVKNYGEEVEALTRRINAQGVEIKKELNRRKKREKKMAFVTNTLTSLVTAAVTAAVCTGD